MLVVAHIVELKPFCRWSISEGFRNIKIKTQIGTISSLPHLPLIPIPE